MGEWIECRGFDGGSSFARLKAWGAESGISWAGFANLNMFRCPLIPTRVRSYQSFKSPFSGRKKIDPARAIEEGMVRMLHGATRDAQSQLLGFGIYGGEGGERLHPARSESRRCVDQRQASPPPVPRQTCCRCANMHSRQHMRSAPRENGVRSLCMAQCEAMERGFPVLLYLDVVVERGRFGGG